MRDNLKNTKNKDIKKDKISNSIKTPIIVGFDPGLTVGIAILDLNGNLLFLSSYKEISKSEIIKTIMKFGKAILIATDVENSPKAVRKLATSLNSKIFSPKNDIPVSYKIELVNNFLRNNGNFIEENIPFNESINNQKISHNYKRNNYKNPTDYSSNVNGNKNIKKTAITNIDGSVDAHERDALSAAILAYKNYENKLKQLERKFLEAKISLKSIDKEDIINENYYEILNHSKSFLINDNPISESISKAFKIYGLIDDEKNMDSKDEEGYFDSRANNINNDTNDISINNINGNDSNNKDINPKWNELEEKLDILKNINKSQEKQIKNQDKVIEKLKNKNSLLINDLNEKDNKINKIEKDLKILRLNESKAVLKDKEVASKIKLLKNIQLKYSEEKKLRKSLEEKLNKRLKIDDFEELSMFTPIKMIDSFTKNGIKEANNLFKLKRGDVLYFSSSKGGGSQTAKYIVDIGVKAIITNKNKEMIPLQAKEVFETNEIPIISENDLDIKFFDDYAVADTTALNKVINQWKESLKEKSTKKAQENLLNVINEYRVERKRDL
ncbi:hypothetical protein SDC9_48872 [bioreactor metagenome]|uniref:DUF460 domain-containing protein n=1 Tax=bioreactor metagenome TaxID=1076179 RepID=A0A644WGJ2_9ZZZZ|nr:DUF460 domain-containing protein [Methanobrevibacter sp.]MEA4958072.1 DUF460 domain-containing protein [Methanobrevibacter sp.]